MKRFALHSTCVCLILSITLPCTGCSEQAEIEKVSLSELTADESSALAKEYENLVLPETITLDQPSQLYTYKTRIFDPVSEDEEKAALQNFVTTFYEDYDESDVYLWSDAIEFYYYENEEIYASCDPHYNQFSFSKEGYDLAYNLEKEAVFYVDRNESIEGRSYALNGTDYALTDAKAYADSLVENAILPFTDYTDARLKTLYVCKADDNNYHYALEYEFLVEGLPVGVSNGGDEKNFILSPTLLIQMAEPDDFISVLSQRCLSLEAKTALAEPFVSLSSALGLAEQYLAEEYTYNVSDIELQYSCIADCETSPYTYKPFWRIVLQEAKSGNGNAHLMPQISLYVDVQTGEICMYDTITGHHTSFAEIS